MNYPKVSFIITCYNGEKFIRRAIESTLNQTYPNSELIIVDDASSDSSIQIINLFRNENKGIKAIFNRKNLGIAGAKNVGICAAKGEYLAFLEQDDEWFPNKIEQQVEVLASNSNVGLVSTGVIYCDLSGLEVAKTVSQHMFENGTERAIKNLFNKNYVYSMSCVAIRRKCFESLGLFDENLCWDDDYEYWFRVAEKYALFFIEKPLVFKHVHQGNASRTQLEKMILFSVNLINLLVDRYPNLKAERKRKLAKVYFSYGVRALLQEKIRLSKEFLFSSFRFNPFQLYLYPTIFIFPFGRAGIKVLNRLLRRFNRVTLVT